MTADLRLLSLGAGVQSTTLVMLAAEGTLPPIDGAIFADTGWEPAAVYAHLARLEAEVATPAGIPVHRVATGNIRRDALDPNSRFASMPLYIRNPDGSEGMQRRQCTSEYKLKPIKAKVLDYLARRGWDRVPKSACIGCPFHGNAAWRDLRDNRPDEWADAVEFDAAIRDGSARAKGNGQPLLGGAFLHRARVPLDRAPIDRVTRNEWADRQATLVFEVGGDPNTGEPDGCSPFSCRSDPS